MLAHGGVVEHFNLAATGQTQTDLFAGPQRSRIACHDFHRHNTPLRTEDVLFFRFGEPQRAQPQRVHAAHNVVTVTGDDRRRTLGVRAKHMAHAGVDRAMGLGHLVHFVRNGREDDFHRLNQVQVIARAEVMQHPVYVLRVGVAFLQGDIQPGGFFPEAVDRVDLTVMAQQGERLHTLEAGGSVGGVAGVAQRDGGVVVAVLQVGVILRQGFHRAAHFVDHAVGAERAKSDREHLLQGVLHFQQATFHVRAVGISRQLPEQRAFQPGLWPQRGGSHAAFTFQQQVQPGTVQRVAEQVTHGVQVGFGRNKTMTDPELRIGRKR